MTFERTRDYELVRAIVTHPQVYRPELLSDQAPRPEEWRASPELFYLLVREAGEALGVFVFAPETPERWDGHIAMRPAAWGRSTRFCRGMVRWLAEHTACRELVARVPAYNRACLALMRRLDWTAAGIEPASIRRGGVLFDQFVFRKKVSF